MTTGRTGVLGIEHIKLRLPIQTGSRKITRTEELQRAASGTISRSHQDMEIPLKHATTAPLPPDARSLKFQT